MTACQNGSSSETQSSSDTSAAETTTVARTEIAMQNVLIYSYSVKDSKDVLTQKTLQVPNSETLQVKLQLIADKVSTTNFNGLGIEVTKIENNIAYIDLQDDEDTSAETGWIQRFQGSTGANITSANLFENFFQKMLSCDWIDAVQLLHNGELMEEMDHFSNVGIVKKESFSVAMNDYTNEQTQKLS